MDQIAQVFIANGLPGAVALGLLFGLVQLWRDGKEKDKAVLAEKDNRLTDAKANFQAVADALRTVETAIKVIQSGGHP